MFTQEDYFICLGTDSTYFKALSVSPQLRTPTRRGSQGFTWANLHFTHGAKVSLRIISIVSSISTPITISVVWIQSLCRGLKC